MTYIAGLYAIADTRYLDDARLLPAVRAAIDGGARIIQYRDKSFNGEQRRRHARALVALCEERDTVFLINDDVPLALAVSAHGVHLGRDDMSLAEARRQLGAQAIIGISCYNDLDRALAAQKQGADYVAFGSFFTSQTKPQAVRASVELLRDARAKLRIPIIAIGGITPQNGAELVAAGATALAAIEGVFGQSDVRSAASHYARLFG